MKILQNKTEMQRLLENHNNAVKAQYVFNNMAVFARWVDDYGHEDEGTNEFYVEIPGNETKSGHAVILDW